MKKGALIMPELPEVETVRRTLENFVKNKRIRHVDVFYEKMISNDVQSVLIGKTIEKIDRLGKYLIFNLGSHDLIVHLRMEGRFFLKPYDEPRDKHEHVIFYLDDFTMRYHDTRKFGTFDLREKKDTYRTPPLSLLAKDPFEIDANLFYERIKRKNQAIKTVLLDQKMILGLGNIYADETLFRSKIHPAKKASTLTKKQTKLIIENAKDILRESIALGGTTIRTYTSSLGVTGRFQHSLGVHQKLNEPCPNCQTLIEKQVINGRSSFYCKTCQKR